MLGRSWGHSLAAWILGGAWGHSLAAWRGGSACGTVALWQCKKALSGGASAVEPTLVSHPRPCQGQIPCNAMT
eukprot:349649-Chlamydomonas_euryale.AAC.2